VRGYLEPGERVRLESRPHGVALARPLARSLSLAAAGAVLVLLGAPLAWGLGAVGAVLLAAAAFGSFASVWRWDRTSVILTSEKLLVVYGVAQRRAAAVRLERVGPVEVEQGVLGRVLGYGTLVAGELEIPYVPDPERACRLAG
jgi:uncharacterized membrane protein YdbT with pleckstrin-like domain